MLIFAPSNAVENLIVTFAPTLPLHIRRTAGGYRITDDSDRLLAMVYCREPESVARIAKVLTFDDGKEAAQIIARALSDADRD